MYTNSVLHIVGDSKWATAVQTAPILYSVHVLLSTVYTLDGSKLCLFRKECIVLFMFYCYVSSVLGIVFKCVVLCIVRV
jgi:hypothetical protein